MKLIKNIITATLISSILIPAQAKWFEVEVIAFSHNVDPTTINEDFEIQEFVEMTARQKDLLSNALLAPSDCPEPAVEIIAESQFDEFGFPIIPAEQQEEITEEIIRTPEEQAAYDTWLKQCEKPKTLNEFNKLPTTIVNSVLPEKDTTAYLLTSNELKLTSAFNKISNNPNYRTLLHTGWRIDIGNKNRMPAIKLIAGKNFGEKFNKNGWEHLKIAIPTEEINSQIDIQEPLNMAQNITTKSSNIENNFATTETNEIAKNIQLATPEPEIIKQPAVWEFEADLRIWLNTWLQMDIQTTLRKEGRKEPESALNIENQTTTLAAQPELKPYLFSYNIEQYRRMRSTEVHYIDHPLMGLIIKITPYSQRN